MGAPTTPPLVLPLRAINSEPPSTSSSSSNGHGGGNSGGGRAASTGTSSSIHAPRRSQSALPTIGRPLPDGTETAWAYARPLYMLTRLSSGPGAAECPVLLLDPPGLKAAEAAGAPEAAAEEAGGEAQPPAARTTGWRHALLMGCASCLPIGAVAGKAAVMAASVRLIADLGMSHRVYGMVAGAPSLATVLFSPLGGLAVDYLGADDAAPVFAFVVLAGCVASTLGATLHSVALLLAGQLLLGIGKPPLSVSQLVFIRIAAGPDGAGRILAVANAVFHLAAFLAFAAFPPLADVVARDRGMGQQAGVLVPLGASTALALISFLGAVPLRGQLKAPKQKQAPEPAEGACAPLREEEGGYDGVYDGEEEEQEEEIEERRGRHPRAPWRRRLLHAFTARSEEGGTVHDRYGLHLLFLVMALFYGSTMAFEAFAVAFLASHQGLSSERAAGAASVFEIGSIVLSPVVGRLADWDMHPHAPPPPPPQASSSRCSRLGRRLRRLPSGSLQLSASALAAVGILLPLVSPPTWLLGFLLISTGTATAGVAFWLAFPLFVCPQGLGRAVGTALALDEVAILLANVVVGVLVDRAGEDFRKGALPFLFAVAAAGTGASVLLVPRVGKAVAEEAAAVVGVEGKGDERGVSKRLSYEMDGGD